jgi:hypothetical protein
LLYCLTPKIGQEADMRPHTLALSAAIALTPALAASAPAAPAGSSGAAADARCLMAMAAFSGASDQNTARMAQAGVLYFAGRIKAQDPSYNLGVQLKNVAASMTPQMMQTEAQQRCGPMLIEAMHELDAAQQALAPPPAAGGAAKPPAAAPPTKR